MQFLQKCVAHNVEEQKILESIRNRPCYSYEQADERFKLFVSQRASSVIDEQAKLHEINPNPFEVNLDDLGMRSPSMDVVKSKVALDDPFADAAAKPDPPAVQDPFADADSNKSLQIEEEPLPSHQPNP